jgi:type IV fimbrial biogenesis protein FimT
MTQRHHQNPAPGGFTVIELMATIAMAAILLTLAAPSFTELLANNRMRSEVFALRALLSEARSEALTERVNVAVCPSDDGAACAGDWNEGYIAFIDTDADGTVDVGERIVLARTTDTPTINLSYSNGLNRLMYNSRGNARTAANTYDGTFMFCDDRGSQSAAGLIVTQVGTVRAAIDEDDPENGINNDLDGADLDCDEP